MTQTGSDETRKDASASVVAQHAATLKALPFSDTTRQSYKHDPLGQGDVPLAGLASVMKEVGYSELPMLEVISQNPDADIADSCRRLREAGIGCDV